MLSTRWRQLFVLLLMMLATSIAWPYFTAPPPTISIDHRGETIVVSADKAWSLRHGDCLQLRWELNGEQPIHIEGQERRESGAQPFCPAIGSASPKIELTDHLNGFYRSYSLGIYYLPDFLLNLAGVAGLAYFGVIALYYLWINDPHKRPSFRLLLLAILALLLCIVLLRLSGRALTIVGVLASLRNLFSSKYWRLIGVFVAGAVYLPLLTRALWLGLRERRSADYLVVGGFLLFIGLLYLPFGLSTVAQFEGWISHTYFSGIPIERWDTESVSRFWFHVPDTVAFLIISESFHSFNLMYGLILWGKLVLLYSILRQLNVSALYAFLLTMLFALYPVDSGLMYLRSMTLQYSFLCLLTAVFLVLQYLKRPSRLYLLGVLLALTLCLGAYESGYALILVVPLLWWHRQPKPIWRNLNLSVIWYLVPALKLAYLALLFFTERTFYRSKEIYSEMETVAFGDLILATIENLFEVYWQSFAKGWGESFSALGRNSWLPLTFSLLALIGVIAWYLWRSTNVDRIPSQRQLGFALLVSLLLILPSVGVLIWLEDYNRNLWRLYAYVPIPAAFAVFCMVGLLTAPIAKHRHRNATIVVLCCLLMLPAFSRLILQHEDYVTSANRKANVLAQIMTIAPHFDPSARVILLSEMTRDNLKTKRIGELSTGALRYAMQTLYEDSAPQTANYCTTRLICNPPLVVISELHRQFDISKLPQTDLQKVTDYSNFVFFLLHEDLSVELLHDLPPELAELSGGNYDASRLVEPSAPLPPRAFTMLGLSRQ